MIDLSSDISKHHHSFSKFTHRCYSAAIYFYPLIVLYIYLSMELIFKAYTAFFFCVLTYIARDGFIRNAEKQQIRYVNSYLLLVDFNIS